MCAKIATLAATVLLSACTSVIQAEKITLVNDLSGSVLLLPKEDACTVITTHDLILKRVALDALLLTFPRPENAKQIDLILPIADLRGEIESRKTVIFSVVIVAYEEWPSFNDVGSYLSYLLPFLKGQVDDDNYSFKIRSESLTLPLKGEDVKISIASSDIPPGNPLLQLWVIFSNIKSGNLDRINFELNGMPYLLIETILAKHGTAVETTSWGKVKANCGR